MKRFRFSVLFSMLLIALWGTSAWAQNYELVTSDDQLVVGDKYLIVNTSAGKALSTNQASNNRTATALTVTNNVIEGTSLGTDVEVLTLGGTSEGYTLYASTTPGYLYAASSKYNYLRTSTTLNDNCKATITIDANGNAAIKFTGSNSRNILRYNKTSKLFACYASGQEDVQLFRYVSSSGEAQPVAAPTFTPDGGVVASGTTVGLACATEGATIYYAIDATDPATVTGTEYTAPIVISATCSITAWAEKAGMTASSRVTKNFTVATPTEYKKANAVVSGQKYLLVAGTAIAQPLANDKTYGYLPIEDVTETDGVITLLEATNAFTFTEAMGGYTIQDSYGRYLYMLDTHNSFNVSTELPETGGIWTVERLDDGAFKVANLEKGKYVQYVTGFTSYGSYSDLQSGALLPVLYTDGEVGEAPSLQEQTLTFPQAAYTATLGETFTAPTVSGAQTTVTYASNNEGVATVDASTGNVTLVAAGQAVITATAATDGTYASASASYTLTVEDNGEEKAVNSVTFDFTDPESLELTKPTAGKGTAIVAPVTSEVVTMTSTDGSTQTRIWNTNGACDLRVYKGGSITFSVPDGYLITEIKFTKTGGTAFTDWEGKAQGQKFSATGATRVATVTITYVRAYTLAIGTTGYATLSTGLNYTIPEDCDLKGGPVTVEGTTATVDFNYTAGEVVPGKIGLLYQGTPGTTYTLLATDDAATETYPENLLRPALTDDEITAPAGTKYYIFANDATDGLGFYFQGADGDGSSVKGLAGKAYLAVAGGTSSFVKGFRLGGIVSGIEAAPADGAPAAPIYTLGGVCVGTDKAALPKGVYIVGGKKVLVK